MAITTDSFLLAESLPKCLSQCNTYVFNGVMGVDMQISLGVYLDIEQAVARYLI
jgi:hypothetical protein